MGLVADCAFVCGCLVLIVYPMHVCAHVQISHERVRHSFCDAPLRSRSIWPVRVGGGLPLRLGWAIPIHKSQSMSMDEVRMDPNGVFAAGQGYVALSRVRTLDGLYLVHKAEQHHFKANSKVVSFPWLYADRTVCFLI